MQAEGKRERDLRDMFRFLVTVSSGKVLDNREARRCYLYEINSFLPNFIFFYTYNPSNIEDGKLDIWL